MTLYILILRATQIFLIHKAVSYTITPLQSDLVWAKVHAHHRRAFLTPPTWELKGHPAMAL